MQNIKNVKKGGGKSYILVWEQKFFDEKMS